MRFPRPHLRLSPTANLPMAAALGLTLCASALSTASAGGEEAEMNAGVVTRSLAVAATGMSTAISAPVRPASAEPVVPQVTDVPIHAVSAARREALDATVERVTWADGTLVAHVVRTSVPEFAMVGVTWDRVDGLAEVTAQVRSLSDDGWSEWAVLHAPDDEGPSTPEEPGARAGSQPGWVGASTGFEIAVYADKGKAPGNLEVSLINPGTSPYDSGALANAADAQRTTQSGGPLAGTFPGIPPIITREEWGADESLGDKCFAPRLGSTFKMVFVHHTAGSNDYEEYESPAVVRGILAYHVVSRGWCDIGYNFLVDRYGNVFEGRAGGIRLPVRGAHSGDYNINTTGISAMGNFDETAPRRPMKRALVKLIAWRLGTAYHGGFGRITVEGDRFSRISGHRDAMSTSCPGQYIYDWLPTLRERVQTRLGDFVSPIEAQWRALGGGKSRLGLVRIGEQGENGGHFTAFKTGRMYASLKGIFALYRGPILSRFNESGGVAGALGYPLSGAFPSGNSTGSGAKFVGGRIYWSAATTSQLLLRSPVLKRYLSEGGPKGLLGFPTTELQYTSTGHSASFEHGTITYSNATGQTKITFS